MTPEFERLRADPDVEAEEGPGGTLVFEDGEGFCVVGPRFTGVEDGQDMAYGRTRAEAIANYAMKRR